VHLDPPSHDQHLCCRSDTPRARKCRTSSPHTRTSPPCTPRCVAHETGCAAHTHPRLSSARCICTVDLNATYTISTTHSPLLLPAPPPPMQDQNPLPSPRAKRKPRVGVAVPTAVSATAFTVRVRPSYNLVVPLPSVFLRVPSQRIPESRPTHGATPGIARVMYLLRSNVPVGTLLRW
jgi:hypothetical protein